MDREPEELQFLGPIGVAGEAYKLLLTWRRLFAQIAAAFVLPLAFISLAHIHISHLLFTKIDRNEVALDSTPDDSPAEDRILSRLASEWAAVLLFKALYLLAVLILSLLSTSAVVYTVASVYTAKEVTFAKVLSVVPKVWKRLMITFLYAFLLMASYNIVTILLLVLAILLMGGGGAAVTVVVFIVIGYFVGLIYISVVWHVASVVSVLEDVRGVGAMKKSRALVKGKVAMAVAVFMVLLSLLAMLVLLGLVVQTVIYFVCKSYHHESIDKSSLADHLEVYLGEYTPLTGKDVQLQQFYV